jgi:hypothetical protein
LVDYVKKSDSKTPSAATIGKLFAHNGAYDNSGIFRYLEYNGIQPYIIVRKNAKVNPKQVISLEIYRGWLTKMICCKDGKITVLAMEDKDDGL